MAEITDLNTVPDGPFKDKGTVTPKKPKKKAKKKKKTRY